MTIGKCLCGGVAFKVAGPLAPVQFCHCSQCRTAQGGAFAANVPVAADSFLIEKGLELLTSYELSPGKFRRFCRNCGLPIYSNLASKPDVVRVRAGLLVDPDLKGAYHFYVDSKCSWADIPDDGLPRYGGARPQ